MGIFIFRHKSITEVMREGQGCSWCSVHPKGVQLGWVHLAKHVFMALALLTGALCHDGTGSGLFVTVRENCNVTALELGFIFRFNSNSIQ